MNEIRGKLIELLKEDTSHAQDIYDCNCRKYLDAEDCVAERTADYLIANGVSIGKDTNVLTNDVPDTNVVQWVSVTERLPEEYNLVLVTAYGNPHRNITLEGSYELAEYDSEGWILESYPAWTGAQVTHWMPLPMPPKEET
jgi:hypothetical protein